MPRQSNVTEGNASPTKSIPGMPANTLKKNNEVSNKALLAALQATGNPERELSTAELKQMKRRTPPNANSSPQNKSKSSSPSSVNHESPPPKSPKSTTLNTTKARHPASPSFFSLFAYLLCIYSSSSLIQTQ
ncbi:MAG: hypothetical protein K6D59_02850 [Bacteroidales bacterium]|nr:hypothetical protein [Bacteroidales bacterium]